MNINQSFHQQYLKVGILILQFWLSGLFILSTIFTLKEYIQQLTLGVFLALSMGSFIGGICGDFYGRKIIFHMSSIILAISAIVIYFSPFYGYILAAAAIGPLNNLTFVLVTQGMPPKKKDMYIVFILMGWGLSEICLGLYFYLQFGIESFYSILLLITLIFACLSLVFIKQTLKQQDKIEIRCKNIIPIDLRPLIIGGILMFAIQMFYYRTQFTLDRFGISMEVNTMVVGVTEVLTNLTFSKHLYLLPRKRTLQLLFFLLLALFGLLLIFNGQKLVQTIIQGVMRICDTAILLMLGVYLPQSFSSKQRSRGTNFVMSFGVIGSACSQYILNILPFWSVSVFLIIAFFCTLFLKQTLKTIKKDQEEPDVNDNYLLHD